MAAPALSRDPQPTVRTVVRIRRPVVAGCGGLVQFTQVAHSIEVMLTPEEQRTAFEHSDAHLAWMSEDADEQRIANGSAKAKRHARRPMAAD